MQKRSCVLCLAAIGLTGGACDRAPLPPTTTTAAIDAAPPVEPTSDARRASDVLAEERVSVPLFVIPFSVMAPSSWSVQSGAGSRFALHGTTPSGGEIDILLGTQPPMKADVATLLLKGMEKPSTNPLIKSTVITRDQMQIAEQLEPYSTNQTDPETIPMLWTFQYFVRDQGLDYSVYQMDVVGLTQAVYERDGAFLRSIFDTVRRDASATQPAVVP